MNKTIITVAPTGNVPTKEDNPHFPVTPDEIAEDIYNSYLEGAAVAHIHVRDTAGKPTTDGKILKEIIEKVEAKCDIVIQASTGARGGTKPEERAEPITLGPEMASLATGSSNFMSSVNANDPKLIKYLCEKMLEHNVKPEIEAFDVAMIHNTDYLVKKGLLKEPLHINMVMNVPGSVKGTPKNLMHMIDLAPSNATINVTGIGKAHVQMIGMGIALGCHVRVGLEDVLVMGDGTHATNPALVKRAANLSRAFGREVATPNEAREMLGLPLKNK